VALFSIVCTTCQAKLRVRDQSAIGKILACPKCGSMVMVDAPTPAGSIHAEEEAAEKMPSRPATGLAAPSAAPPHASPNDSPSAASPSDPSASDPSASDPSASDPSASDPSASDPSASDPSASDEPLSVDGPGAAAGRSKAAAPPKKKPRFRGEYPESVRQPGAVPGNRPSGKPGASPTAAPGQTQTPVLPGDQWASPATRQLKQIVVLLCAAVFGIALAVGVIAIIASWRSGDDAPATPADVQGLVHDTAGKPAAGVEPDTDQVADAAMDAIINESSPSSDPQKVSSRDREAPTGDSDSAAVDAAPDSDREPPPVAVPPLDVEADTPPGLVPPETMNGEPPTGMADPDASPTDLPAVDVAAAGGGDSEFVKSQLSFVFNAVQEAEISLADVGTFVTQLTTVPVTLDLDSLAASGISASTPLSYEHRGITLGQLLTAALEPEGMTFVVDRRQIIITTIEAAEAALVEQSYNVADLVETQEELQALAKRLTEFVQPASWNVNGGVGSASCEEYALAVEHVPGVHFQVAVLLNRLRLARGLLPRGELPVEWIAVDPVFQRAATELSTPITVNYSTSTTVSRILDFLNNETDLTILVNWRAATAAGWTPNSPSELVATDEPLAALLSKWLAPAKLSFRVVDERTIEISSLAALEARPDVEFYRLQATPDLTAIESNLRDQLGRENAIPLYYDEPSGALVVSLPQFDQRRVADILSDVTTGR
jgi:hypothetical protein